MLSKSIQDALNDQMKDEMYSSYVYLSMAAYCAGNNLDGFAHWMKLQSREEWGHAMRLYEYILNRGGKIVLQSINEPPATFQSPLDIFEHVVAHEQSVSKKIHSLYSLALKESDYATQVELQWFISEQVEEEKTAIKIVDQLKMVGDNKTALLMLDRELGSRAGE